MMDQIHADMKDGGKQKFMEDLAKKDLEDLPGKALPPFELDYGRQGPDHREQCLQVSVNSVAFLAQDTSQMKLHCKLTTEANLTRDDSRSWKRNLTRSKSH